MSPADDSVEDRIEALHAEAEDLADIANTCTNPQRAAQYRTDAKRKVRQAARLRQEGNL